jgi:Zn-finger nucleic acid-binding protein
MSCRRCQALFDRNLEACPVCKTKNQIDCPRCAAPLERREAPGLRIDLCRGCRGSWFDNVELAQIWNLRVDAAGKRGLPARSRTTDYFLLESVLLFGDPFLSPLGGAIGSSAGQALAGADLAGVAADAVESTGSLAGSVFETIAHVIGSLFEG